MYAHHLEQLDAELTKICCAFHVEKPPAGGRQAHLHEIATEKQHSVTQILTQILNDKKHGLPFLLSQANIARPQGLRVSVLDHSAEGLSFAARLANKPFKQAVRMMAAELGIPKERVLFGPVKSIAGISGKQQRGSSNIFDLNRATIAFESEIQLKAILGALPRFFDAILFLDNKFKKQWERATQPPCLHLNLRLKPESLPPELAELLAKEGGGWIVELQLSMMDFLDVKKRCHAIYEILRLEMEEESKNDEKKFLPLPRACPVCGLLQHYVMSSQLVQIEVVSFGQKLVNKCLLNGREVAYNLIGLNDTCAQLEHTFIREVSLLTRLDHPNVLQITGVVRENKALGFVTEWVSHGTLWSHLQEEAKRRELNVWDVAYQLCDALVYVHNHGVVHFDLKSKNVLLARNPAENNRFVVKLCDFGLSREMASTLGTALKVGGTPNWQAPETWGAVTSTSSSADVYAFGCMLIELFGLKPGCYPWMQQSGLNKTGKKQIKRQVQSGAMPPELSFVADPLIHALTTDCLAFDARLRPTMKKARARLLAAHISSPMYDSNARRILAAMDSGRVSFPELFVELRNDQQAWLTTMSFLERYVKVSPRFELALALCRHFAGTAQQEAKEAPLLHSLYEVCEQHMEELVAAKFLAGWCCDVGTGGATKNEERARMFYRQAAAQGYPAAQLDGPQTASKDAATRKILDESQTTPEEGATCKIHIGSLAVEAQKKQSEPLEQKRAPVVDCSGEITTEEVKFYKMAADQGNPIAQFNLGLCYEHGTGAQQDLTEAARLYRLSADQGNVDAQCNLGLFYENGLGVQQDFKEAARLYQLASEQGDATAQFNLGLCYENGRGVNQDANEAVRWYSLSADQGETTAQRNLVKLYKNAADQGNLVAQFNLGLCYEHGTGVQQDLTEAARLYRLSADQGNVDAQCNLGLFYENGLGVQQDINEAAKYYQLAAKQGDATAQFNLGLCFMNGRGMRQDLQEAVRLFSLAVGQGDVTAHFNLGLCYESGRGVQKDMKEAVRLYTRAAEQGDATAQFHLGWCYQYGLGVNADFKEAHKLYTLSAEQGNALAQFNLGLCFETGTAGAEQDLLEATRLYRLSADQGNVNAQCNLGLCYEEGRGVQQDANEANRLFKLAGVDNNNNVSASTRHKPQQRV